MGDARLAKAFFLLTSRDPTLHNSARAGPPLTLTYPETTKNARGDYCTAMMIRPCKPQGPGRGALDCST